MTFSIGDRLIGEGESCFIIAEAGVNHDGSLEKAKRLVDVAVHAGADAVKFQTFNPEKLVSAGAGKAEYQKQQGSPAEGQKEMLEGLRLSPESFAELAKYCSKKQIIFLSTPFDVESLNMLLTLGMPAIKIPSGELTHHSYLADAASRGLPLILSTGMATLEETGDAVDVIRGAGCRDFALLHCVSCYPALPDDVNLAAMQTMGLAFSVPIGYSDHTLGIVISIAAVAMGACVLEKHFTLDRHAAGPDHKASLEPSELSALVRAVRVVEAARGSGVKVPAEAERDVAIAARRSLFAACSIRKGEVVAEAMIRALRPARGLPPYLIGNIAGRNATRDIAEGELILPEMVE